jgi:hypothetical protein
MEVIIQHLEEMEVLEEAAAPPKQGVRQTRQVKERQQFMEMLDVQRPLPLAAAVAAQAVLVLQELLHRQEETEETEYLILLQVLPLFMAAAVAAHRVEQEVPVEAARERQLAPDRQATPGQTVSEAEEELHMEQPVLIPAPEEMAR